jgi:hypothetical protein
MEVAVILSIFTIILSDNKLKHVESFLYINIQVLCMSLKIDEQWAEKYVNQLVILSLNQLYKGQ